MIPAPDCDKAADMTIKAILFDKDGTLLDFHATFAPATAGVLAALAESKETSVDALADAVGFNLAQTSIKPGSVLIAGSLEEIAKCLLPFCSKGNLDLMTAHLDELYVEHSLKSLTPFSFLKTALDDLQALGLKLGVATNDSEIAACAHLDQIGIAKRFCFVAGFDSGHGEKPAPGMVRAYIDHLGLSPEQVIMVGDSPHDCKAGRAAGAVAVAVTSGGAPAEELAPHADHVVADISELPALVQRLNTRVG